MTMPGGTGQEGRKQVMADDGKLMEAMVRYLDCACRCFEPMSDDSPIMEAYREALERGKKEGFIPVLVTVDETLWECLVINTNGDSVKGDFYAFDREKVEQYRKEALTQPIHSELLERLGKGMVRDAEEYDEEWDLEMDELSDGEELNCFNGYWHFGRDRKTYPLILAEVPVKNPWEVFAYLPFGGWNECPDTLDLMAVAKYWFELYGAVPAVITHDVLECMVPEPVSEEQAKQLALEQYTFCPDIVEQGVGSVGALEKSLSVSTVWYFWWD